MAFKLERRKLNGKPMSYRTLFCQEPNCVMKGDTHSPLVLCVDDHGEISLECGICGEASNLSEVVEICNAT